MVFHKLLTEPLELCMLKLSDLQSSPAVRGPDHARRPVEIVTIGR